MARLGQAAKGLVWADFSCFFFFAGTDVARRYVPDRGGNVFVLPSKGLPAGHSSVVRRGAFGPTPDVALADAMAHSLGLPVERPAETSAFFEAEAPLRRRRLGVLIALEGATEAGPALRALHPDVGVAPLVETSAAQDETALLASCAAGRHVAEHGIVGASFHSADGVLHAGMARRAPALADRLDRGSAVLVAAGSEQAARALAPFAPGPSSDVLAWSEALGLWVSHASGRPGAKLDRAFPACTAVLELKLEHGGAVAHLEGAAFELARPAHLALLAQLELLLQAARSWRTSGPAEAPGLFAFAVTGLARLEPAVAAAAGRAAQRAAAAAVAALEKAAGPEGAVWQVLLLDQSAPLARLEAGLEQAALLAPHGLRVYGRDAYALEPGVCVALNKLLWRNELVAVCPSALTVVSRATRSVAEVNNTGGGGSSDDSEAISHEEVVSFQLVFWLTIVLFLVALAGSALISSIDIPSDSPLLRNLPDIYKSTLTLRELM
jgi:hypothetical protein